MLGPKVRCYKVLERIHGHDVLKVVQNSYPCFSFSEWVPIQVEHQLGIPWLMLLAVVGGEYWRKQGGWASTPHLLVEKLAAWSAAMGLNLVASRAKAAVQLD